MKPITEKKLLIVTALCSLLLSLWLTASNDIISRDSTLYLKVAQTFLDGGFVAAFKAWSWPFYPVIFAIVHQITGLNLEYSAYLLNAMLNLIVCVSFVKIYSRIAFNGHRLWIAALFIITFSSFNDYRGDIIRGYGFWAFTLLALNYYLAFIQTEKKMEAVKWQLSIFSAALFRPEAVIFAVAAPLFVLFYPVSVFKQRLLKYFLLSSFILLVLTSAILALLFSSDLQQFLLNHRPVQADYISPSFILGSFYQGVENLKHHVLMFDFSARYAGLILASGLMTMLLYKVMLNLGVVYTGIWFTGVYKKWLKLKPESWIVLGFALIALAVLMSLNFSRFYVSSRYIVLLVILLGLIVSQYLDILLVNLKQQRKKWLFAALVLYIAVQFLDSVISIGASKGPIKEIAQWAVQELPEDAKLACNEPRLVYYSKNRCLNISNFSDFYLQKNSNDLNKLKVQYLLLWIKHKDKKLQYALNENKQIELLKKFSNRKDDFGALYAIRPDAQ